MVKTQEQSAFFPNRKQSKFLPRSMDGRMRAQEDPHEGIGVE